MRTVPFFSSDWFLHFCVFSAAGHILLIMFFHQSVSKPEYSVKRAQSSIEISLVQPTPSFQREEKPVTKENVQQALKKQEHIEQKPAPVIQEKEVLIQEDSPRNENVEKVQEAVAPKEKNIVRDSIPTESNQFTGAVVEAKPLDHVNPPPHYPKIARRNGWEGTVLLKVSIDIRGTVKNVEIHEGSGYASLDRSAVKTVRTWKFSPAKKNGSNIASVMMLPVEFKLVSHR